MYLLNKSIFRYIAQEKKLKSSYLTIYFYLCLKKLLLTTERKTWELLCFSQDKRDEKTRQIPSSNHSLSHNGGTSIGRAWKEVWEICQFPHPGISQQVHSHIDQCINYQHFSCCCTRQGPLEHVMAEMASQEKGTLWEYRIA